jgi:hypothetical protein
MEKKIEAYFIVLTIPGKLCCPNKKKKNRCNLYNKNVMIVNDATNWSITQESSHVFLEPSISHQ